MHKQRLISAFIALPLILLLVYKGGVIPFGMFVTVLAILGLYEFYSLWENEIAPPYKILGVFLAVLFCLVFGRLLPIGLKGLITISVISVLLRGLGDIQISSQGLSSRFMLSIGGTLLGLFYVVWLIGHLIWLRQLPLGREAIFLVFLITISSDSGAYYVGSAIGRRRLAPKISPGKSIEGAIGGLIASVLASYIARGWFYPMSFYQALFMGLSVGISAQAGDLSESLLKRGAQVKDSGSIIPGHGGLLDRLDSLLFSAPCLYYYLKLAKL